jgi:hypothetical protein
MVKPKRHIEALPFSSDDEIDSDDFDSDLNSDTELHQHEPPPVAKSRNKYVTGLYSALGLTEEEIRSLKAGKSESSACSSHDHAKNSTGRPPPEIITFDDPAKRKKVSFLC